jgi:hypothetical protein
MAKQSEENPRQKGNDQIPTHLFRTLHICKNIAHLDASTRSDCVIVFFDITLFHTKTGTWAEHPFA